MSNIFTYLLLLFIVTLLLLFETYILKNQNPRYLNSKGYSTSFFSITSIIVIIILGLFSAFRKEIGIDYVSYIWYIDNMSLGHDNYMELGFKELSVFLMDIVPDSRWVLGIFSVLTVFLFVITINKLSYDKVLSIFLFLSWGYYFFTFNTVRNYFALALVFFSLVFFVKKKYVFGTLFILIAALFHKSALICIPFYLIATRKFNIKSYLLVLLFSVLLIFFQEHLRGIAFFFYSSYENSVYDSGQISLLNILKTLGVLILGLYYRKIISNDFSLNFFFNLNYIAFLIYTVFYWLPETSRIGFYFNIISILFIPNLIMKLSSQDRILFKICIYLLSLVLFIMLLNSFYNPNIKLLPYQSWIIK